MKQDLIGKRISVNKYTKTNSNDKSSIGSETSSVNKSTESNNAGIHISELEQTDELNYQNDSDDASK